MPHRNIAISAEAYARLKKYKHKGDSFTAVVMRELPEPPARTAGELLRRLKPFEGKKVLDDERVKVIQAGRKRRKARKGSLPHAA
jgi:predicted CopG family antitoxin